MIRVYLREYYFLALGIFLSLFFSSAIYAAEFFNANKNLNPSQDGLPPPLTKPLKVNVCFFDIQGKNGDFYSRAKDLVLIARRWNVFIDLIVFNDSRKATESFKAEQCDAAAIPTAQARQFNLFMGSVEAVGGIENHQQLQLLMKTLLDPKVIPLTITEPFQILGIQPIGANYIHVHDKNINTIEEIVGKKMAVLDWDKIETIMAQKIGMQPVASTLSSFVTKFNNNQVDIIEAPAIVYRPFELNRGLGESGGIFRLPINQMMASLVINRQLIRNKLPDLDEKLLMFRSISVDFMNQMLGQIYSTIEKAEADIPAKYWISFDASNEENYWKVLRNVRIEITKEGDYDPRMTALLKRIRCKNKPEKEECKLNDE